MSHRKSTALAALLAGGMLIAAPVNALADDSAPPASTPSTAVLAPGTGELAVTVPAGCVAVDCATIDLLVVGDAQPVDTASADPLIDDPATAVNSAMVNPTVDARTMARATRRLRRLLRKPARRTRMVALRAWGHAKPSVGGSSTAAKTRSVHRTYFVDASWEECSVVPWIGCTLWYQKTSERFYENGAEAWATHNHSWVICTRQGGTGFSVDTSFCGFRNNPAPYGHGDYLHADDDFEVSAVARGVPISHDHYIRFHDYGDGYVGFHRG